jgi:uncharacterized protein DUF4129
MRSTPEFRRALPATLAAIAEAGVLYVILHDVAINEGRATGGPMASYPLFLATFTAGVALATGFRQSLAAKLAIPVGALGIGALQATVWGRGGPQAIGTAEILALILALRVATMAVRDWREPVAESFALGTVFLLGEVAFVARTDALGGLMPFIAALFFAGSLASRAASVWLANRPEGVLEPSRPRARPQRSAVVLVVLLGVALIIAVMLGSRGGPVEVSGAFLYRWAAEGIAFAGGLLAAVLLPVLSWFLSLVNVHIEPQSVKQTAQQIKPALSSGGAPIERIIGAVAFVLILLLLLRAIRRQWKLLQPEPPGPEPDPEPDAGDVPQRRRRARTPRIRRELPVDTIRRWYAEALLALERLGLPKPPSRTPGEYLPEVARAFPESARGFTALTRAYEQVRYGSIALDRDAVGRLEVERDGAMQALGRARRIDDPDKA